MTMAQLSTFMAMRIQKKSARRYVAMTIRNPICSKMPTETATTRWNTSLDRFRTALPPFAFLTQTFCRYYSMFRARPQGTGFLRTSEAPPPRGRRSFSGGSLDRGFSQFKNFCLKMML